MARTYTITQLAEEFGITPRAIRFYEDRALLSPRREGQNRIYSPRDRVRLGFILRGKRLGFRLDEIREMLDLYDLGDGQAEQLRVTLERTRERLQTLRRQRQDIDQAIGELEEAARTLETMLASKRDTPSPEAPARTRAGGA
jgi:DNA-binding transcriptional MerR regulator